MLYQIIIVIHILLGLGIIGLVLIQQGKGADAGATFGGGASGSVFGAQGSASFLSRTTAVFASLFFITSLGLAFMGGHQEKKADLIDQISVEQSKPEVAPVPQDVPTVTEEAPVVQNKASDDAVSIEKLPDAPAIKEVEPATEAQPSAK